MGLHFLNNESFEHVPVENRIVGVIYVLFSIVCTVPYIVCLWSIISDKQLRKKPSYIIVFHVGVVDVAQLVFNGIFGGVFTFFGTTWGFWTNKAVGGVMNINWVVYTAMAHVLSFNRYIFICKPQYRELLFSKHRTEQIMFACWVYGFLWLVAYMCPDINLVFNVYYRSWDYDEVPLSRIFWLVELLQDAFHFFMSIIWYALSFYVIKQKAGQISAAQIRENKKERKLLIQAMLICSMIGFTLIGFFGVPAIFDNDPWSTTASTLIWLACCGNNCAIYLVFNKSIRRKVFDIMFPCRNRVTPDPAHGGASVAPAISHDTRTAANRAMSDPPERNKCFAFCRCPTWNRDRGEQKPLRHTTITSSDPTTKSIVKSAPRYFAKDTATFVVRIGTEGAESDSKQEE